MKSIQKANHRLIFILCLLACLGGALYLFPQSRVITLYLLKKRSLKLGMMALVAIIASISTISFQTVSENRFLTPSILGIEGFYVLLQSFYYLFKARLGSLELSPIQEFFLIFIMQLLVFAVVQPWIKRLLQHGFTTILLICMAIGTLLKSTSTFIQVLMDPNEYDKLQARLFPSFQRMNDGIIWIVVLVVFIGVLVVFYKCRVWDVMYLRKDYAIELGVSVEREVQQTLWLVVILLSASTAMVGPMTFFGFLVTNLTYQLSLDYRHQTNITIASLLGFVILVVSQFVSERFFHFEVNIRMIIELGGGLFFFYLLWKERGRT